MAKSIHTFLILYQIIVRMIDFVDIEYNVFEVR